MTDPPSFAAVLAWLAAIVIAWLFFRRMVRNHPPWTGRDPADEFGHRARSQQVKPDPPPPPPLKTYPTQIVYIKRKD